VDVFAAGKSRTEDGLVITIKCGGLQGISACQTSRQTVFWGLHTIERPFYITNGWPAAMCLSLHVVDHGPGREVGHRPA
jgi:hypothetical protein